MGIGIALGHLAVGLIKEDPDSLLTNYLSKEENKTQTSLCVEL